ncbi:MAG: hypothetical protein V4632_22685 [Pseudomonadota bacterium]
MLFHLRPLVHFQYIQQWVAQNKGRARLDMLSFGLEVIAHNRIFRLTPQFIYKVNGKLRYRPDLSPDVTGFIGWLPYFNKQWEEATDKIAFKKTLSSIGRKTPAWHTDMQELPVNVLVKESRGSFGEGLRGPYRQIDPAVEAHQLAEGEFYEQFVPGKILKVWYWNGELICLELREPLCVRGDGSSTVLDLCHSTFQIDSGARKQEFADRKKHLHDLLAYQDAGWDTVLSPGAMLQIDYLYGSCMYMPEFENVNQLRNIRSSPLEKELLECGPLFWRTIPEAIRKNSLFSVDAVIDDKATVWWLEINCNPMFPPDAYPRMLDCLFKE